MLTVYGTSRTRSVREPFDMAKMMELAPPPPGGSNGPPGGMPKPSAIFGVDENAGAAVVVDSTGIVESESRRNYVLEGEVNASEARNLRIYSEDGSTGGLYVSGKGVKYTLKDSVIELKGNTKGLGGKASGVAVDEGAELTLKNVKVTTWGVAKSATSATDSGIMYVHDSELLCHGAPFSEDPPTPSGRVRDIQGNARGHITMSDAKTYFYNSKIIADGWAAISTDIAQGKVYVEANDCQIETVNSGYTTYADGGCEVVLNRCHLKSACMTGVIAGEASMTFRGCDMEGNTFGTKFHCIGQPQEVGQVIFEDCVCHTKEQCAIVYSHNVELFAINSHFSSDSGIMLEVKKNVDPNAAKVRGKTVYGVHATFNNCNIQGSFIHTDPERTTDVYLNNSTVYGGMQNVFLWMREGSAWYATSDSNVTLVGTAQLSQFNAPEGVTIIASAAISGEYILADGGRLILIHKQ